MAIVGASGAGKSSLLGVLLGFLPYRGSLQVNGRELRALSPRLWRERLSWVSQSPALPDGLDSAVREDAGLLSVGQAQRVALARALIRTPGLLLLDKPTASLDVHSERLVMRALKSVPRRQTTKPRCWSRTSCRPSRISTPYG